MISNDIEINEHLYRVFSDGTISSLDRFVKHWRGGKMFIKGKILRPIIRKGYYTLTFSNGSYRNIMSVHRVVAEAFIPNPENKPQVNHKNGIKTDNRFENLEWCTQSENIIHAYSNNLIKKMMGSKNHQSKLSETDRKHIFKWLSIGIEQKQIAKWFNVSRALICIYNKERIKISANV